MDGYDKIFYRKLNAQYKKAEESNRITSYYFQVNLVMGDEL